jgi:hypothetical protein
MRSTTAGGVRMEQEPIGVAPHASDASMPLSRYFALCSCAFAGARGDVLATSAGRLGGRLAASAAAGALREVWRRGPRCAAGEGLRVGGVGGERFRDV